MRSLIALLLAGCQGCPPESPAPHAPKVGQGFEVDPAATALPDTLLCAHHGSTSCFLEIPAARFRMGAQAIDPAAPGYDPDALASEGPVHEVAVSTFFLQRNEVTVGQYERCLKSGWCDEGTVLRAPGANLLTPERRDHPMNFVSWHGAQRFCARLGGRLPTEAEWELAARGTDGRRFPWGDEPGCGTGHEDPTAAWSKVMERAPCRHTGTSHPSDLRGDSPYGVQGMAANVWEWTSDTWAEDAYAHHAPVDPEGPTEGTLKVQRGGSWTAEDPVDLRSAARAASPPEAHLVDVGFRCAWVPPAQR